MLSYTFCAFFKINSENIVFFLGGCRGMLKNIKRGREAKKVGNHCFRMTLLRKVYTSQFSYAQKVHCKS